MNHFHSQLYNYPESSSVTRRGSATNWFWCFQGSSHEATNCLTSGIFSQRERQTGYFRVRVKHGEPKLRSSSCDYPGCKGKGRECRRIRFEDGRWMWQKRKRKWPEEEQSRKMRDAKVRQTEWRREKQATLTSAATLQPGRAVCAFTVLNAETLRAASAVSVHPHLYMEVLEDSLFPGSPQLSPYWTSSHLHVHTNSSHKCFFWLDAEQSPLLSFLQNVHLTSSPAHPAAPHS